jgi:hypothetical protein
MVVNMAAERVGHRNVRYEKFPVSVYRKNYTDIIGIPVVFL